MKPGVEEVVQEALALNEDDRAEVAARLLDSLEQEDTEAEDVWVAELERRAEELESGAVQGIPWEDLRDRLMRVTVTLNPLIFHPYATLMRVPAVAPWFSRDARSSDSDVI